MDPTTTRTTEDPNRTVLEHALDVLAEIQTLEERLPRRSLAQLAVVGLAVGLKNICGELDESQPKRRRAA
jgi:hypothetical protein